MDADVSTVKVDGWLRGFPSDFFLKTHLFSVMIRWLHLAVKSMDTKKKSTFKSFVGILSTFHRTESKIACYTVSHKYSPGIFLHIHMSII